MAQDGGFDAWNYSLVFWEIVTLVVIVLVVSLAALAVRRLVRSGGRAGGPGRRVLDERYARGEIGRGEYERKRRDLLWGSG